MNKTIILLLLLTILISCKNYEKANDQLEISKKYFDALNKSSSLEMNNLLTDSLTTTIPKYDYTIRYSKSDYVKNWLKWDSVFEPTYKVLEMNLKNKIVKAKVSKTDKRILFFMQKPFVANYIVRFQNNKIASVEEEGVNFDETTWKKNRTRLLNWTKENHPELHLDHFINVQTKSGGEKLLKAIELYKNKK